MTSTTPTTPNQPDFAALQAELARHRQQAQAMLRDANPITHQATLIQGAIAHSLTGLLLVAETMTAERAAELAAAADEVPAEPVPAAPRERTTARVRVFHNNDVRESFLRGYQGGQSVTEVFAYDQPTLDTDDMGLAERAFELFNIGDDPDFGEPDQRAVDYRSRGNRSLSVGDVIAIDEQFLSCDSTGWRELDQKPDIHQRQQHGTTPLYY